MARKDLIRVTASVDGRYLGEFRTFEGGDATSADIKSTPGAGQGQIARGGRQTVDNVTIAKEDDGAIDVEWLISRRGKGRMVVHWTPTDEDGNNYMARQRVFTGKLLAVRVSDADLESDTDLAEIELEQSCDSRIG